MVKRPFFGLAKPRLGYGTLDPSLRPVDVPLSAMITLLVDSPLEKKSSLSLAVGDKIKSGQVVYPFGEGGPSAVACMGGTVVSIDSMPGNFGKRYTAVTIEVEEGAEKADLPDVSGGKISGGAEKLLCFLPGGVSPLLLEKRDKIKTLVVLGADEDLGCITRQYAVKNDIESIARGARALRDLFGTSSLRMVMAVPEHLVQSARAGEFEVLSVEDDYPCANPRMLAAKILGSPVPAGTSLEDAGVAVISAEAAASIGRLASGELQQRKLVTVLTRGGKTILASVVVGTPVADVLSACSDTVQEGERVVLGGPMTGVAVYTDAHPVLHDTDMILVQGKDAIPEVCDNPCINCGECVRICPAGIQVNVLIRYLQAGEYGEAVDNHDLLSCIQCGLCAFVCPARIPIFQYIKLGMYEFARSNAAEAENG